MSYMVLMVYRSYLTSFLDPQTIAVTLYSVKVAKVNKGGVDLGGGIVQPFLGVSFLHRGEHVDEFA
jgi:hypothetical protein